ncbi:dipeptidase-2 [Coleophoma cylindrospora]|uniref:Dipeptidase n=1 Tax=Coleophoma cylindrospora TaxID=1849047 RepID=A0A3D8RTW4_9HELO|nr:dipeptidase-2 [Coleophoma cylindrospora]
MAGYSEQDPLLPKDKPAPEIHGSRPTSVKSIENEESSAKRRFDGLMALFAGICALLLFSVLVYPDSLGRTPSEGQKPLPKTLEQRVSRILATTPLIDGHNDLAILVRFLYNNHIYDDEFKKPFEEGGSPAHVDLPRLIKGKSGGAFWSAFVPCPANGTDFSDANYAKSVAYTMDQLDVLRRIQAAYPTHFSAPPNSSTAMTAFKKGQLISPLAIEGLHQIGNSVANLRLFHSLGVRYATLTHNCHNIYADAALLEVPGGVEVAKPYWGGISSAGQALISEMNRIGMIVDLAHVSQDTMRDVLGAGDWAGSKAPIIYSHSSAYSVCPHPRNVPDDILELVKKTNSVVMVNFSPDFVSCTPSNKGSGVPDFYPPNSTLAHVVTHIMHIGDLIGYEHVGLGSDFDGIPTTPEGLDDVSKFPDLVAEMLKRGVSDADAAKVVGGNVLRVWADVDKVALDLQKKGMKPLEDELRSLQIW